MSQGNGTRSALNADFPGVVESADSLVFCRKKAYFCVGWIYPHVAKLIISSSVKAILCRLECELYCHASNTSDWRTSILVETPVSDTSALECPRSLTSISVLAVVSTGIQTDCIPSYCHNIKPSTLLKVAECLYNLLPIEILRADSKLFIEAVYCNQPSLHARSPIL